MIQNHDITRNVQENGTYGPSAFNGIVRPIDCISFVDTNIEDAEKLLPAGSFPKNLGRGSWELGPIVLKMSEDGTVYHLASEIDNKPLEQSTWPLAISLIPRLAMAILSKFKAAERSLEES